MLDDRSPDNDATLDLKQGAEFLHLGVEAMRELVQNGEVAALVLNQKHTVMLRSDLIGYIREKGRKQAEERRNKRKAKPEHREPAAPRQAARRGRVLPNLDTYEAATKDAQPDQSRAGSHSA
ncbi:hypothetical protein [Rhodanobacter sp. BL-MT-08]